MTVFVLAALGLGLLAAAILAIPLWRGGARRAALAALLLPVLGLGLYSQTSDWSWDAPAGPAAGSPPVSLAAAIQQLEARLAANPEEVTGWKLLGRSRTVLGDLPGARAAFEEAVRRSAGRDAEAIAGLAETLVLADERELDGRAGQLFEQALALAPADPRGLWFGGFVALRRGDVVLARQRWQALQQQDLPEEIQAALAERLAALDGAGTGPAGAPPGEEAGIAIEVRIAAPLAASLPATGTLFLIARRDGGGPPLAVARHDLGAWPRSLTLADRDAMLPGTMLRDEPALRITARISRSAQPAAASGDLYGEVGYHPGSKEPLELTIDRIVP